MSLFEDCDGIICGLGQRLSRYGLTCPHNNIETLFPNLKSEWHPENKPMCIYKPGSTVKVKWICPKNPCGCHIYVSSIGHRCSNKPTNCPYCSNRKLCGHNNLEALHPELKAEWDPSNPKPMNQYSPGTSIKVKWICSKNPCGCHRFEAVVHSRTGSAKSGCPYCATNNKICEHNNLESKFPELKIEWHPDNPKPMNQYSPISGEKVKWICSKNSCGCHIWTCTVSGRSGSGKTGCPFCSGNKICLHNNLEVNFGHLKTEWDSSNPLPMNQYASGSNEQLKWICTENPNHKWYSTPHNRTKPDGRGCPHCVNKGYSKAQIKWLQDIEKEQGITIQHALSGGEFYIPIIGNVDGYHEPTNTVYEYHGDYWHGNPSIFDMEDINPTSKKTFGELYQKTLIRDQCIRNLGFNLIVKWETDIEYEQ